jgi:hypothetical protein
VTDEPDRPSFGRALFVGRGDPRRLAVVTSYAFLCSDTSEPGHTMPNGQTMPGMNILTGMETP